MPDDVKRKHGESMRVSMAGGVPGETVSLWSGFWNFNVFFLFLFVCRFSFTCKDSGQFRDIRQKWQRHKSHVCGHAFANTAIIHLLVQGGSRHQLFTARWHQRADGAQDENEPIDYRQGDARRFWELYVCAQQFW